MTFFKRLLGFIGRVLRGEDVVLVPQSQHTWNEQYKNGTWQYALESLPNTNRLSEIILSCASDRNKKIRVLDVGCGHGALGKLLQNSKNIEYIGVDFSFEALLQARSHVPDATFILHDIQQPLTGIEGVFDFIVFNEVLYYVDPQKVLLQYKKYANDKTRILISIVAFQLPLRSWFVWRRVRKSLATISCERVLSRQNGVRWDMLIGKYVW